MTPAPYPLAVASRPEDHGAQVTATLVRGSLASSFESWEAGGQADGCTAGAW